MTDDTSQRDYEMTEYRIHPDNPRKAQYRTGRRRKWRDVDAVFYQPTFVAAWVAMMNRTETQS